MTNGMLGAQIDSESFETIFAGTLRALGYIVHDSSHDIDEQHGGRLVLTFRYVVRRENH